MPKKVKPKKEEVEETFTYIIKVNEVTHYRLCKQAHDNGLTAEEYIMKQIMRVT